MSKRISIFISNKAAISTAVHIINYLIKRNIKIYIHISKEHHDYLNELYNIELVEFIDSDILYSKNVVLRNIYRITYLLITGPNYSHSFRVKRLAQYRQRTGHLIWSLYLLFAKLINVKKNNINKCLFNIFSRVPKYQDKISSNVIVITHTPHGLFLCNKRYKIITIMESWDHGPKQPLGYVSHVNYLWGNFLVKEWAQYQGDGLINVGYPWKLDYVVTEQKVKTQKEETLCVLYCATYCSNSDSKRVKEEFEIMMGIAKAAKTYHVKLLIKPKPSSRKGELDFIRKRYPDVDILSHGNGQHGNDYILDNDYNKDRLNSLKKVDYVINLFTTFAFDAACFGIPVVQLRINNKLSWPNLYSNQKYIHLEKFFEKPDLIYQLENLNSIDEIFRQITKHELATKPIEYTTHLRSFMFPKKTKDEVLSELIDNILN